MIPAWTGDELWYRQTQNGGKFGTLNLTLNVTVDRPTKAIWILTKVFYTFGSHLVILAWTGLKLSCGQASDWHTDGWTDTDAGDDNRVTWGKTPTLRIESHISITNGWKSLKMIYDQELVKFSVCRIFFGKIHDIVEMKRYFWSKMGVLPHMWAKRPPRGAKRPPMGISPRHYDDENVESLFIINRILLKLQLDVK